MGMFDHKKLTRSVYDKGERYSGNNKKNKQLKMRVELLGECLVELANCSLD
jgi:hypothetical protein